MSSAGDVLEEVGLGLFRAAVAVGAERLTSWIRAAVDANPDDPISRRVAEILPAESESEKAARTLRGL